MRTSDWSSDVCSSDLDGAYKRLHGASLLRCIVTCPERQRCNRHAGLVPASNFPRASMSEERWTPGQVRGDGADKFWGKPRCPVLYYSARSVSAASRSTDTSRRNPGSITVTPPRHTTPHI